MQAPLRRVSDVLARHGIAIRRSPRWIEDASGGQIARMHEAIAVIRQK